MKTRAQLRVQTSIWLNDRKLTAFSAAEVNDLLNMAYPMIVAVVEASGRLWNVAPDPIVINVTAAAREYSVENSSGDIPPAPVLPGSVRKIIEVRRISEGGGLGVRIPFMVLSDTDRSYAADPYPELQNAPQYSGVYLYRAATSGGWMLGFAQAAPAVQTLHIRYVPTVPDLADDADIPWMVPGDFHHVIAMRAALIGKGTEERQGSTLPQEYAEQVRLMLGEAGQLTAAQCEAI